MGTKIDPRIVALAPARSVSGWTGVYGGTGATGFTTGSARPRVQDTKLHMVAADAINVWPSSLSGPCSG
ncbi:hypothetical protein K6U06_06240 [Acidiferrimicrobium sp. IK]|uniref:hypothetical protein n=1 Tax=Acidiferrimicrobium sp. IK TaxID=2871700 RepID=UPI0021CB817F|nr:hypothetical protein [Acidiferrimicrobium sp. IK]MCU4183952.1 hypothetical protein [Acidiferrimicrobium sp. IK]